MNASKVTSWPDAVLRQLQQLLEALVPSHHAPLAVEHHHAVPHIVEGHAQHGAAPLEFARPLIDHLLEPRRRLLALLEQALQLDCIAPKDLDRPAHRGDLVGSLRGHGGVESAARDGEHPVAERGQAADDIAADVKPHDQHGGQQAQRDDGDEDAGAQALDRQRVAGRVADIPLGRAGELVDRGGELRRQAGVLGEPPFAFADERELLPASLRDGVRPLDELPQLCHLLQEQRPQLGIEAGRRRLEVAQRAAELEGEDRKAPILVGGRGFGQHVHGGGDLPLGGLRRPLQFDQRRQPPRRVAAVILDSPFARRRRARRSGCP